MKFISKNYLHIDSKISYDKVKEYISSPTSIATHSFLPLIHSDLNFEKFDESHKTFCNDRPVKVKTRKIMYAGHLDNFIYKYYAELLNTHYYNQFCKNNEIDDCIIAYRNNKPGQSNIHFAAEVINSIVMYEKCYILIGDFSNYFNHIDHSILKANLKKVLNTNYLNKDWFNIFKSVTKYGYYDKDFLEEKIGTKKMLRSLNKRSFFESVKKFRNFQRIYKPKFNNEKYGIPQGTAISAVFANIYAINFDIKMRNFTEKYLGLYRRYSDDFILIIPYQFIDSPFEEEIVSFVKQLTAKHKIDLQDKKTDLYLFDNSKIKSLNNDSKHQLDYLGFVFDGQSVKMRSKSPYKFYRNAKKQISFAKDRMLKRDLNKLPYRKRIYKLYTDLGTSNNGRNNFIDYAKRAQLIFDKLSPQTNNIMMQQINNRKKKIEKLLGYKIHSRL